MTIVREMETRASDQRPGSRGAKFRLAALLLVITLSIVASKLGEEHFVESLQKDCSSLFADRLIPATTLFQINDALHLRRDLLVRHLRGETPATEKPAHYQLGQHEAAIEHHIAAIEKTYLVADEVRLLRELRASHRRYTKVEGALLDRHVKGERVEGYAQIQPAFDDVHAKLLELTKVQESVGQELTRGSFTSAANVITLLHLQLGVAFVLGLLASGLALSLRPRGRQGDSRRQLH
jgi:hypothetical protein